MFRDSTTPPLKILPPQKKIHFRFSFMFTKLQNRRLTTPFLKTCLAGPKNWQKCSAAGGIRRAGGMHLLEAVSKIRMLPNGLRSVWGRVGRILRQRLFVKTSAKREKRGSGGIAPSGVQGQSPWAQVWTVQCCSITFRMLLCDVV